MIFSKKNGLLLFVNQQERGRQKDRRRETGRKSANKRQEHQIGNKKTLDGAGRVDRSEYSNKKA